MKDGTLQKTDIQPTHLMKTTEALPFYVVVSRNNDTSDRLIATRHRAFAGDDDPMKTSPHFINQLKSTEGVLISAESKSSGECLGSVRVDTNLLSRFYFEEEITTSDLEAKSPSICASKLNAPKGPIGMLTRMALSKTLYLYAHAIQATYIYCFVNQSRFRLYRNMGFKPVFTNNPSLTLKCHHGIATKMIRSEVNSLETNLSSHSPALKTFFFDRHHPDIKIFASVSSLDQIRRRDDLQNADQNRVSRLLPTPTV
jgi:hypothetical protein